MQRYLLRCAVDAKQKKNNSELCLTILLTHKSHDGIGILNIVLRDGRVRPHTFVAVSITLLYKPTLPLMANKWKCISFFMVG